MQMSDDEIRTSYRQAKDPVKQIKILAQLNCCSVQDIKEIIKGTKLTTEEPKQKRKYTRRNICTDLPESVVTTLTHKISDLDREMEKASEIFNGYKQQREDIKKFLENHNVKID